MDKYTHTREYTHTVSFTAGLISVPICWTTYRTTGGIMEGTFARHLTTAQILKKWQQSFVKPNGQK